VTDEEILGPPHADIGLQRQPAQAGEDPGSAPPTELVPDQIHGQCHDDDRTDHQPEIDAAGRGERSGREEGRDRRQGNPQLLEHRQSRHDDHAVAFEPLQPVRHRRAGDLPVTVVEPVPHSASVRLHPPPSVL
jgi:hypothetical protein